MPSFSNPLKRIYRYNSLSKPPQLYSSSPHYLSTTTVSFLLLLLIASSSLGFLFGHRSAGSGSQSDPYINLDTVPRIFTYNRTFSEVPSNQTDRTWRSIYPSGGGFFTHPAYPDQRVTLSVFHQLHCLDGIRHGYWAVYQAAVQGNKLGAEELRSTMAISPAHIRHCIDLLRQSLMCCADTTVETKEKGSIGVKGFGTEHGCKDWEQLREWTSMLQDESYY